MDAIQSQLAACNNHRDTIHSSSSTSISEGGMCGNKSIWLCNGPHAGFPRRALLAAPKRGWPTSQLWPVELPGLARLKVCFAVYDVRSIDELLEHTTGRFGDIRPDTNHAIGGTAELTLLQYSANLRILRQTQALLSDDYGPAGAAGAWATRLFTGLQACRSSGCRCQAVGDYGPTGSSGRRSRLCRSRSTFRGTTGRTDQPVCYAEEQRCKRTTRLLDLPGAGQLLSSYYSDKKKCNCESGLLSNQRVN